jgi:hypothetical protein
VEEGGSPDESYIIPLRFLNLDDIRKWFHEILKKADYSLFTVSGNNCATAVYLALKKGGLNLFKKNWWATLGMFIRFPDDNDPSYEDIQTRDRIIAEGGIEDLPVQPQTAFSWIKDRVEELQGNKKWWWPF